MAYVDIWQRTLPKARSSAVKPTRKTTTTPAPTAPRPPDAAFMASIFPEYNERSEADWAELLDARTKPFEAAAEKSRIANLSQSEFLFEQSRDANKGLALAFADMFQGGKTGDEGLQFAKENFGSARMGMQVLQLANQQLAKLTSDWTERDWQIASEYQKALAEIPGVREQLRQDITKDDQDEYTRNFNIANLILDEAWNVYEANAKQYNTDQQIELARIEAAKVRNQAGYTNRKDAVAEASKFADDNGNIWSVRRNKDGSYSAYDTGKKKPVKPGSKPKPSSKTGPANQEFITVDGVVVKNPNYKPPKPTGDNKAQTPQQQAESDLTTQVQVDWAEKILGKEEPNPNWYGPESTQEGVPKTIRVGGMNYTQAFNWLLRIARDKLTWRSDGWIQAWVRNQLTTIFPEGAAGAAKPGGG